jgi:hypothetical protein
MSHDNRGMKLRSRDGHFEMADFDLKRVENGYWMWIECKFDGHNGGHWLAPDGQDTERVVVASVPYQWPSAVDAFAARDRFAAQQGK